MPDHSKSYPSKTASGASAFGLGDFTSNATPDSALTKAMIQDMVKWLTGGSVIPFEPSKGLLIDEKEYADYNDFQVIDDAVLGAAASMAAKAAEELNKIWSEVPEGTAQEIAARPPATAPFDWAKDLNQPKEFWIYEIQYRNLLTGRAFNDGWSDWQRDVRHPSQYSTERRAKNALAKRVERRERINQPFEFRIQPIYFGHAPNFGWERKSKNLKKPKPNPVSSNLSNLSNLPPTNVYPI